MSNNPSDPHGWWKPGDVANGHILGQDSVWHPLLSEQPQSKPWYKRPLRVTGIVVGSLFVFGMGSAMAGGGDPSGEKPADESAAVSTPDSEASDAPAAPEEDSASATPTKKPKPKTFLVTSVVDGDTIDLGNGQTVRLVGIDSPDRGDCGYERSSDNLARLVLGKQVRLAVSDEDSDQYGRLLRYVDVGSVDTGLSQIKQGYAIARYDSRDGYGFHPREPIYIQADGASKQYSCPKPKPVPLVGGDNCMAGYLPCLPVVGDLDCGEINGPVQVTGTDPYRLDADGDGIGCDS